MNEPASISTQYLETVLGRESIYDGLSDAQRLTRRMRRLRAIAPGESVLDIGCGTGTLTEAFAQLGLRATGVDVVPEFVEAARERHPDLMFETAEAESLPFEESSFDYVTMLSLLEHARDWRQASSEAVRVLKPGGVVIITTTNRWCPKQHEISGFPGFGLYPAALQRAIYRWAAEHRPEWIGHTHLPAYHWLSFGVIARELERNGASAHHWLSLQGDDDIPARLQRPLVEPLVRFAFRHPVPLTYPLETATYLYAQKRGDSPAG